MNKKDYKKDFKPNRHSSKSYISSLKTAYEQEKERSKV
jgi:hypothetical protein